MAFWLTRVTSASTRMLSLSMGCFESAGRQCYSVITAVPSFLPQRAVLVAREHRAQPPPLPEPKYLEMKGCCRLEYIDIRSSGNYVAKLATLVLVHGGPGSYRDYRYLIPLLAGHPDLRIIGINLPGYGGSVVEEAHYIETVSALRTAEIVLDGIRQLCGTKEEYGDVFLVGHSFGAHTVINMAASNATEVRSAGQQSANAFDIRGMALIAPAGCIPHKSLRMGAISWMVKMLKSGNALAVSAATHFTKFIYTKILRFPGDSPDPFVSAVIRAGTTDFDLIRDQAKLLGSLETPTFITWAEDDEHIQSDIPKELAMLCPNGPRLQFAGGGHNLQKTRAEHISSAIAKWVERIVAEEIIEKDPIVKLP